MMRLVFAVMLMVLAWRAPGKAFAEDAKSSSETGVKIDFVDPEEEKREEEQAKQREADQIPYAPPIEQIFQNPALTANLAQGAEAINRSVETLMDSLFYSLLDQELNFYATDFAWFNTTLNRNVYTTPTGAYLIVDRFLLGPRYARQLWNIQNVPITLGVDGSVEVRQIYLRTDGLRLAEQEQQPTWRRLVNNWFGLVPLLAMILPPSFNQNALYDPVTYLETPFTFPLDPDKFYGMPVGSIRSYAISGGVLLSPDFGGLLDKSTQAQLDRIGGLTEGVPYSLFKRGEHRINVLRRDENTAWVGVTELNRTGQGISPLIAQKYYVLRGLLSAQALGHSWAWGGMPINMLPVNIQIEQALVDLFDQVYEFDLRNPLAAEAYQAATRGDFTIAHRRYLDAKEKGEKTGVVFHFARQQDRNETVETNGPNVAVFKKERQRNHNGAEIEITDQEGKFYVLESELNVSDKRWDFLGAEDETRLQQTVEMKVKRVITKDVDKGSDGEPDKRGYTYAFEVSPNPYNMTLAMNIQDKYVDTDAYEKYLQETRYFSDMPIKEVPSITRRDPEAELRWHRQGYFSGPADQVSLVHVTPTYLGTFGAQAAMSFSTKQLQRIIGSSEDAMWAAFGAAFDQDVERWRDPAVRATIPFQAQWFEPFFLYPLRLINVRFPKADAIVETTRAVAQLIKLKTLETPEDKLEAFKELIDTDHPIELARALLTLSDEEMVPRRVTFTTKPNGPASHEIKTAFGHLNNMIFKAGPPFPTPSRYERAKLKLGQFYLDRPREAENKPRLSKIQVTTREIPESIRSLADDDDEDSKEDKINRIDRHVFITFTLKGPPPDKPLKVYVRIEQGGKLKIGKLALAEKVLDLTPIEGTGVLKKPATYEFFVTGPTSPLSNFMLDQAVNAGDEFVVNLAVSTDGEIWSDEKPLQFRFERGRLYQAQ